MEKFNHIVRDWERNFCREVPDSFCAEKVRVRLAFLRLRREIFKQLFGPYYHFFK